MSLADDTIWHQMHLERYKKGVQNKMVRELEAVRKDTFYQLKTLRKKLASGTSQAYWTERQLEVQLESVSSILKTKYATLNKFLDGSNRELTHNEIKWNQSVFQKSVGGGVTVAAPTTSAVFSAVRERPFQGWLKNSKLRYVAKSPLRQVPMVHIREMQSAVRTAFVAGRTTKEVEKAISAVNNAIAKSNAAYNKAARNIGAEARTSLQTHANRAREETISLNSDLFPWVEFMATLDSRTSEVCGALDGRAYRVEDESRPTIPQHWNCRSTYIPKQTRDEDVGIQRPAVEPTSKYKEGSNLTKTGKVRKPTKANKFVKRKQVASGTKFNTWLKAQDQKNPAFVRDYFKSDSRYEAWKAGKLGEIQFTSLDGRTYNIKALGGAGRSVALTNQIRGVAIESGMPVKGLKLTKAVMIDGKRVGGIWKTESGYFAKRRGKDLGYFDSIEDAESAILAGKKPPVKKVTKKVVIKKVTKKKITKKKVAKKPGQTLIKKIEDENGKRFGGLYEVVREDGSVFYRARRRGKWLDVEFDSIDAAEEAIRAKTIAKKVPVKKKITEGDKSRFEGLDLKESTFVAEVSDDLSSKIDDLAISSKKLDDLTEKRWDIRREAGGKLPTGAIGSQLDDINSEIEKRTRKAGLLESAMRLELKKLLKSSVSMQEAGSIVDKIAVGSLSSAKARAARRAMIAYVRLTNGYLPKKLTYLIADKKRAYMQYGQGVISVGRADKTTMFHEMSHYLDYESRAVHDAVHKFIERRRFSKKVKQLSDLTGNSSYAYSEVAYEDKFISHYVGKKYNVDYNSPYNTTPTEVTSMGMQYFTDEDSMMLLLKKDPEHFRLMLGILLRIKRDGI